MLLAHSNIHVAMLGLVQRGTVHHTASQRRTSPLPLGPKSACSQGFTVHSASVVFVLG